MSIVVKNLKAMTSLEIEKVFLQNVFGTEVHQVKANICPIVGCPEIVIEKANLNESSFIVNAFVSSEPLGEEAIIDLVDYGQCLEKGDRGELLNGYCRSDLGLLSMELTLCATYINSLDSVRKAEESLIKEERMELYDKVLQEVSDSKYSAFHGTRDRLIALMVMKDRYDS